MTTTSLTTTSTVDSLLGAYRSHVLGRSLPGLAALHITPGTREISIQPGGGTDLCTHLSNVLVWAHTMAEVTAEWWHTDSGSLHVSVTGRTAGGVRMKVYGGGAFTQTLGLVPLDQGQREGVSLDELYALACLLRDGQHEQEVA
jgi:hypothetical protein